MRAAASSTSNPALPSWLPDLTIHNLRAGTGALSIGFRDGTVDVLANTSGFEVIHGPAPRVAGRATLDGVAAPTPPTPPTPSPD